MLYNGVFGCHGNACYVIFIGAIFTSPPIGGGRGIVMPMSVCVCVCPCLSVFSQNFKV